MRKSNHLLLFSMLMLSNLAFANNESKLDNKAALKKWEATPEGIFFKKWESSAAGKKVYASEARIRKSIKEFSNMEAIVTSLTLPAGSRLGYGVMVRIKDEDFILSFGPDLKNEFDQIRGLKVNDKIVIKSHSVSHAPKYAYPIVAGDYVERDGKLLYKRIPGKGGC
ncbi:MAG: hypothetical protein ACK4V7_04575 [Chitinophagaceae bacterium]